MKTGCRRSLLGTVLSTAHPGKGMAFSAMGDVAEVYSEIKHNQTCVLNPSFGCMWRTDCKCSFFGKRRDVRSRLKSPN